MLEMLEKTDFILLDFDGLLVNTEHLHYRAYLQAIEQLGSKLTLSFDEYLEISLAGAQAIKTVIDSQCLDLAKKRVTWEHVYALKKQTLIQLVKEKPAELMPGVLSLLKWVKEKDGKAAVVTNSPKSLIDLVKEKQPQLQQIPHWITREEYKEPKPNPECYLLAMKRFCKAGDRVIGFEDSPKGMRALISAQAHAVMVCPFKHIKSSEFEEKGFKRFYSLQEIFS